MKSLLVFLLLYVPCNGQESYSFITKYTLGEKMKYKEDSIFSFNLLGRGETFTGFSATTTSEYLGAEDGFKMIRETMDDVVATQKTFDKVSANHETNQLIGVPYTLYIDSLGGVDHIETEYSHLEEEINNTVRGLGELKNFIYPYGKNGVGVKIGDVWTSPYDSLEFFMGEDDEPNYMTVSTEYSLDKVKHKKKKDIAYISAVSDISADLLWIQDSKIMEGTLRGELKHRLRFNLSDSHPVIENTSGSCKWDFVFEDKNVHAIMDIITKNKRIK